MSHSGGFVSIIPSRRAGRQAFRWSWSLVAIIAVGLCSTSGCEDEEATKAASAEHTFTNETVTIAVPKGMGFLEGWKGLLDEWGEQTGAAYRLVEYEDGTAAKKDLPTADLIILPFAEMGEFVAADRLSLMPPVLTSGDSATAWLDYFSGLRERVLTIGGAPAIIPFSCPVLTCYYRRDLLEKAGKKPPRTWDEYQALVESLPSWAPGLSAAEPWGQIGR